MSEEDDKSVGEVSDADAPSPSSAEEDALFAELARAPEVTPVSSLIGTTLGRYTIQSILGRGGMGIVFRAKDTVLDREVALKLVPPEMLSDPERRERFVREARSAAAATHANIAAVYDVGEADGQVFLAMELVEGESLRARLRRGALDVDIAITVARGVVRGLAKAHEKGIIHRDLKPDNVMLGDAFREESRTSSIDSAVKLLDFGLAKLREEGISGTGRADGTLTYDGRVLGTPAYMSPEQAKGKPVDARSDIFSFGVVFYEMLAGERPFQGESAIEILAAVTRDTPPPLPAAIPNAVRAIVERCLSKPPERRYATSKDLLIDLEALDTTRSGILSQSHASARSIVPGGTVRSWRNIGLAIAAASAVLFAIAFAARETPKPTAAASPSASAASSAGRAVTDHPRPKSQNPAALAAYASALQNLRDGSIAFAGHEFGRAAMLDPELAAAHLRVLHINNYRMDTTKAREHFAAASQHRSALDARDVALLQASEELIREKPNSPALARAMTALAAQFPDDAEIGFLTANVLNGAGHTSEAKVLARRGRTLDPQFAAALWQEASIVQEDDPDTALRLLDECLRISPAAASCLRIRSSIRASRGDCAGFEADARRMTEIEPRGPRAYEYLAAALAARGAPLDSVRAALDKRTSLGVAGTADSPQEMKAQADLWVALLGGDLVAAESAAIALDRLSDGEGSESAHVLPALTLIDIYEERGEPERALAVGEAFVRRLPAWTANAPGGVRARLIALRRRAGTLDEAHARAERDALVRESIETSADGDPRRAIYTWLAIEAQYAKGQSEGKAALLRLPHDASGDAGAVHGFEGWARGKAEILAGREKEGVASLRRALSTCVAMPTTDSWFARVPFAWMEAQLLLAEALEDDDRTASCQAYARVVERWRDPKPRSVSVEKARARARAKGCVPSAPASAGAPSTSADSVQRSSTPSTPVHS